MVAGDVKRCCFCRQIRSRRDSNIPRISFTLAVWIIWGMLKRTDESDRRVCMVTWNVAQAEAVEDLTRLLGLDEKVLPNLYAIGLQELHSNTISLVADSVFDDPWTNKITKILGSRNFVRIESIRLLGMHLVVYVRRTDLPFVTNIEKNYTRAGLGGLWGNKGAVSIRLDISGVNICIVNCHLAAHLENSDARIQQYDSILESQQFFNAEPDVMLINDHDYVFWIGDLNFRLDDVSTQEVKDRVARREFQYLWQYDQLKKLMKEGLIFLDFEEGPLLFPPTYKYDRGTNYYDTSAKKRKPGWCDRVLWMVHEDTFEKVQLGMKLLSYTSIQEYKESDHKPVVAYFNINVLKEPPEMPIVFEPITPWNHSMNAMFNYTVEPGFEVSGWDWIGLYKGDFHHFNDYITYFWAPSTAVSTMEDGRKVFTVNVNKSYVQECSGSTTLCYHSAFKKSVVGYSDPFRVRLTDEESESEPELSSSESDS